MSRIRTFIIAAALLALPAASMAQACLGIPSRDGQIGVFGSYADVADDGQLGGDFFADITGPASFEFAYRAGNGDADRSTYAVRGAYELYLLAPSICLVGGVLFRDNPALGVDEQLGIPLGFGVGKAASLTDAVSATLFAIPQYVWLREVNTELQDGPERILTSNEFMGEIGLTLGFRPFYAGAGFLISTIEDPGLRVRLGLVF